MRLALYQPDIPQNAGTLIRLGACLGVGIDLIEPCGFLLSDARFRRAGMDYVEQANIARHASWEAFRAEMPTRAADARLVLLTTKAPLAYTQFVFGADDIILVGREGSGVPEEVHEAVYVRLTIPMREGLRSLNVALAAAMVLGEALRQTKRLPL